MQRFRLFIWILFLAFIIPSDGISSGGSSPPPEPPKLSISPSTQDVFYVNRKYGFTASGGHGGNVFSTNIGSINSSNGAYTAPSYSGTAAITVRDSKGNTATYRVPVYFNLGATIDLNTLPTNGSTTVRGNGGVGSYRYSTQSGNGSVGATNGVYSAPSGQGNYKVTVTDSRGNTAQVSVSVYPSLKINPPQETVVVLGAASFRSTGGLGTVNFSASRGVIVPQTGSYTAPSTTGAATATAADSRGAKAMAIIDIYPKLMISPASITLPINGSVTFTCTGGMGTKVFASTNGDIGTGNGVYKAPSKPGTSTITVTDGEGNKSTAIVTINPILSLSPSNINLGLGLTSPFAAAGGVPPYTFTSSFGGYNSTGVNTILYTAPGTAGSSIITVEDSTGIKDTSAICVFAPLQISPSEKILVINDDLNFSTSGGCEPYSYDKDIGSITQDGYFIAPSIAGSGKVTVTDNAGNTSISNLTVRPYLDLTPPPLTLPINGTFPIVFSGGIGPFKYTASNGTINVINGTATYTAPGTEDTVTITIEDSTGKKETGQICVYQPLEISPTAEVFVEGNTQTFTASHGCKPYVYSKNIGDIDSGSGAFTATTSSVPATGIVTVTDLAKNTATASITINPPLDLLPATGILEIGKKLPLTASGGIPGYTYKAEGGGTIDENGELTAAGPAGPVTITVTDSKSYNKTSTIDVYSPLKVNPPNKVFALGDTLTFVASDGFPDYTFTTDIGKIDLASGFFEAIGDTGEGMITVTDARDFKVMVPVTINDALAIDPTSENLLIGEIITFTASGGIGDYSFDSNHGGIDENGVFTANSKGTAIITLTDEGGHSVTATVNVYEPIQISPTTITLAPNDPTQFSASGGVPGPGYTYSMDIGFVVPGTGEFTAPPQEGNGKVTVKDSIGNESSAIVTINPALSVTPLTSNLEVNKILQFTAAGGISPYTYEVSSNGGSISTSGLFTAPGNAGPVTITVKDSAEHSVQATVNVYATLAIDPIEKVIVVGGTFKFTASGGVGDHKFTKTIGSIVEASGDFSAGATPGSGTVTVADSIGNTAIANVTVNSALALNAPSASMPISDTMKFTASGGVPGYTFTAVGGTIDENGVFTSPGTGGQAVITVEDSVGTKREVEICVFAPLEISPVEDKVLAFGNTLLFTASEGCKPYVFKTESNGVVDALGLYTAPASAGNDKVIVTDDAGNSVSTNITINPTISISPAVAITAVNREISFTSDGGGEGHSFSVDNGQIILLTGDYTAPSTAGASIVTVTDGLGNTASANVTVNPDLEISPLSSNLVINGTSKFTASGGVGPYTFSVPAGSGTIDDDGNYTAPGAASSVVITVTDADGFEKTATIEIFVPLKISPEDKLLAIGDTFTFTASDGIEPYKFTTDFAKIGEDSGLFEAGNAAGAGNITVTDSIGNEAIATIRVNTSLAVNAPISLPIDQTLDFESLTSGGIPGYTYTSDYGDIDSQGNYQAPNSGGKATITVTDSAGVSVTSEICIFAPLEITPTAKILVQGESITFVASEGCSPYVFTGDIESINSDSGVFTAVAIVASGVITVTDAVNNSVTASIQVNPVLAVQPPPEYLEAGSSVQINVTGGIPAYTYTASIGSIDENGVYTAPIEPGSATIKVTDSAGAFKTVNIIVYKPLQISDPTKTLAVNNTFGFSAIDGVPPYVFTTDNGGVDSVLGFYTAPGSAGSDRVIVTDHINKTAIAVITVTSALSINPSSATLPVNRTLSFESLGGVPAYNYTADNGQVNLTTGVYTAPSEVGSAIITSTDSLGNVATANVTVTPGLEISPSSLNLVTNGSSKFDALGGVGPYTFSVPVGSGTIDNDGNYTAPGLTGSVVVKLKDAENFEATATVQIFNPLVINPTEKLIVIGDTFTFIASGGIGPYKFTKTIGTINEGSGFFNAGLSTGSGIVTVTDSIGNTISANVTVAPELTVHPKPTSLAINNTYNFKASTSGGIPDYVYEADFGSFSNGIYTAPSTGGKATVTITDQVGTTRVVMFCIFAPLEIFPSEGKVLAVNNSFTFTANEGCTPYTYVASFGSINSTSGTYTAPNSSGSGVITVTDDADNAASTSITVNPALTVSGETHLALGESTNFTAEHGVGPYTFSVPAGSGSIDNNGSYTADGSLGTITITVRDSLNNSTTTSIIIYGPLAISPSENQNIEVGEELQFTPSGGVSPYTFSLSSVIGTVDENGLYKAPNEKGTTTLTLSDDIGNDVSVELNIYASLILTPSSHQLTLVNESINFIASEGVPDYLWSVSPEGPSIVGGDFNSADPGDYTVTVTDSVGKEKSAEVSVALPLSIDPETLTLVAPGIAAFTASGGFPPYKFTTDKGSIDEEHGVFNTLDDTGDAKITVTDDADNTAIADVTILPPFKIVPDVASVEVGEDFVFTVEGGVTPYNFTVDGGSSKGTVSLSGKALTYTAPDNAGNYVISGIDDLNNSTVANVTVFAGVGISPPSKTLALNATQTFTATGGTSPYTFTCDKGTIVNNGDGTALYTFSEWVLNSVVTVRDANNKTAEAYVNGDFPNTWIWATGYKDFNQGGHLSGEVLFPGARGHSSNWADNNGNIYLQGGIGYGSAGDSNTAIMYYLWQYNTITNNFISLERGSRNGSYPSDGNFPRTSSSAGPSGRYGASTWTDPTGKYLWLFGGFGYRGGSYTSTKGQLNDLWKYDISTTNWFWMSGSREVNQSGVYGTKGVAGSAHPGGRSRSSEWRDSSGNLWVFGGFGSQGGQGYQNDMWKFDVTTSKWIWMDGPSSLNDAGKFTPNNDSSPGEQYPSAREGAVNWTDSNGIFWMFGGSTKINGEGSVKYLNDLWKYESTKSSDRWTLVRGDNGTNKIGVYGPKGEANSANYPGARDRAAGFTDKRGNIWLFGGYGYATEANDPGFMNDLWRLNPLLGTNEWVFEGGENTTANDSSEVLGSHGDLGVAADSNWPGARSSSVFWQDSSGKFWFFGGARTREVEGGSGDFLNDLWKFYPE